MRAEGGTPRTWTQERLEATGGPALSAGAALGLVLAGAFIAVEIATERLALAASVAMRPGLAQDRTHRGDHAARRGQRADCLRVRRAPRPRGPLQLQAMMRG